MSGFFGDLVVPEFDWLEAARVRSCAETAEALLRLSDTARRAGFDEVWTRVELLGCDGIPASFKRFEAVMGVDVGFACLVGIGFGRDYFVQPEVTEFDRRFEHSPDSERRAVGAILAESASLQAAERAPEIAAVRHVAELGSLELPFPLSAATNITGSIGYDFEIAWRRRLAYMIGFEASIRAGSLDPYLRLYSALVTGSAVALETAVPGTAVAGAFSVFLNLLATLDGAVAYERAHAAPHPRLPGPVVQYEAKRDALAERFAESAALQSAGLTPEGRVAVRGLQFEIEMLHKLGALFTFTFPRWGTEAASSVYSDRKPRSK